MSLLFHEFVDLLNLALQAYNPSLEFLLKLSSKQTIIINFLVDYLDLIGDLLKSIICSSPTASVILSIVSSDMGARVVDDTVEDEALRDSS